jgi:hypothetical protein
VVLATSQPGAGVFVSVATDLLHVPRAALKRVPGPAELTILRSDHGIVVHTADLPGSTCV